MASSFKVGLLGRGIAASSSPAIHEREAAAQNIALTYELFDFDQLGLADDGLAALLRDLVRRGYAGVNITHPFKQAVILLLDAIDPVAKSLGAVNCVTFADGRMTGSNSDWIGFAFMLRDQLPGARLRCVAQIGAGGAGSATAFALLHEGAEELRIHDVSMRNMEALGARLAQRFPVASIALFQDAAEAISGADGVVQSTPIGMAAHPGLPFDPSLLSSDQWLAEVIYFPAVTQLLQAARDKGLATASGAAMVVGQAAEAFRLFTHCQPDRARMMDALLRSGLVDQTQNGRAA